MFFQPRVDVKNSENDSGDEDQQEDDYNDFFYGMVNQQKSLTLSFLVSLPGVLCRKLNVLDRQIFILLF